MLMGLCLFDMRGGKLSSSEAGREINSNVEGKSSKSSVGEHTEES